jgi:hypothetical protein
LFFLSTSNSYSLPFPLKEGIVGSDRTEIGRRRKLTAFRRHPNNIKSPAQVEPLLFTTEPPPSAQVEPLLFTTEPPPPAQVEPLLFTTEPPPPAQVEPLLFTPDRRSDFVNCDNQSALQLVSSEKSKTVPSASVHPPKYGKLFSEELSFLNGLDSANSRPGPPSFRRVSDILGTSLFKYRNMLELQSAIPWTRFLSEYQTSVEAFNLYASQGLLFGARVVMHAHHFGGSHGCASASPLEFGENMPALDGGSLLSHFARAVELTGLNLSLLVVRKTPLSMFDSVSSCLYAMRAKIQHPTRNANFPRTSEHLLKACLSWLLDESKNGKLSCLMNIQVERTAAGPFYCIKNTTILDEFVNADALIELGGANLQSSECQSEQSFTTKYVWVKRALLKLRTTTNINAHPLLQKLFPMLNDVFLRVLCEMYFMTVIVIDHSGRCVLMFPYTGKHSETCVLLLYKIVLASNSEYYYGVIDNDKFMKQ